MAEQKIPIHSDNLTPHGVTPLSPAASLQSGQPLQDIRQRRPGLIRDYALSNSVVGNTGQQNYRLASKHSAASRQFLPQAMDITTASPSTTVKAEPLTKAQPPLQQRSTVLKRQFVHPPSSSDAVKLPRTYSALQKIVMGMAAVVFMLGLVVSIQTLRTNHQAAARITTLAKQVDSQTSGSQNSALPSIIKPSNQAISQYEVAPDLPRYITIPKFNIFARVLQVGITPSGALATPDNVYDTAWYTGSAKPGQPGATLIDGHVSSWTTHGVFYNIRYLNPGDTIQITLGNGTVITYQVVKTQIYNTNNVDMQAALIPVTPGKAGLNLITCTGQVEKGTNEFNERVIVFAQQV